MRSIKFNLNKTSVSPWDAAVVLLEHYLSQQIKSSQVLEQLPASFKGDRRAQCQSYFLHALRHGHKVTAAMAPLFKKAPRARVQSILMLAGAEIERQDAQTHAKVVHFTVEHSKKFVSKAEIGFLNALLRKLPQAMAKIDQQALAAHYSHPDWLVDHWQTEWGEASTAKLLQWNQQTPNNYIKLEPVPEQLPPTLLASQWPKFFKVAPKTNWNASIVPLLNQGTAYIKDPSTRLAPELLAPVAGEQVLDLCAAPGGKAFDIAQQMKGQGLLVAVDLPGNRIPQLKENLVQLTQPTFQTAIVEKDVLKLQATDFSAQGLPPAYAAVMLDAPCSNTGVIQRRIDVKWRLQARDISSCAELQLNLLQKAAEFVAKAGRLVYSTCSIERAENIAVVQKFLKSSAGAEFELLKYQISLPWETGHDGAGAFLLKRH